MAEALTAKMQLERDLSQARGALEENRKSIMKQIDAVRTPLEDKVASLQKSSEQKDHQIDFFTLQVELAQFTSLPLIIHQVRAFEETMTVLNLHEWPSRRGFFHSFTGNKTQARRVLEAGFMVSIGTGITRENAHHLREAIKHIPDEKLLIESDSPDQKPVDFSADSQMEINTPESILLVAQIVGELKQKHFSEILDISRNNLKKLIDA